MEREDEKPRVGVSACLLGEAVRYDGGHKRHAWLVDVFGRGVAWVPICPEVEIGLGIPRPPIDLVRAGGGVRLIVSGSGVDLTDRMRAYAGRCLEALAATGISGYVLKAGSPSCGLIDVPVIGGGASDRGLFAAALTARCPDLPVVEERQLDDDGTRRDFAARVRAYHAKMRT